MTEAIPVERTFSQHHTQTLHALVHRACQNKIKTTMAQRLNLAKAPLCLAPGAWQPLLSQEELTRLAPHEQEIYQWRLANWPQVFVQPDERIDPANVNSPPKAGQGVGDVCPCCGGVRVPPEDHGQIWSRSFDT